MTNRMKAGERSFRVVRATAGEVTKTNRYIHKFPEMAAKKAGRILMANASSSGAPVNSVTLELHEISMKPSVRSSREVYFYTIVRTPKAESHSDMGFQSKWHHEPHAATAAEQASLDRASPPTAA
jgi:hypothetical protein